MQISSEIRARIIAAADELYQGANRERYPTVDQVRRAARADMNTTSTIMKEWRQQQTATDTAAITVPDRLHEVMGSALSRIWHEAQERAADSMRIAQQDWDAEKAEAEALRQEIAEAYEAQALDLEKTQEALAEEKARIEQYHADLEAVRERLANTDKELSTAKAQVESEQKAAAAQAAELEKARKAAAEAREETASLKGQLEAAKEQNKALLEKLG